MMFLIFSPFYVDNTSKHRAYENGRETVDSHDQPDLGFRGVKLFEIQRKNEKQRNAHKEKKESDKSHKKMSVPHGF